MPRVGRCANNVRPLCTSCTMTATPVRGTPWSRNARAISRGSAALASAVANVSRTATRMRDSTVSGLLDDFERAGNELAEFIVAGHIGRHEIDGGADRPQQQLALEA